MEGPVKIQPLDAEAFRPYGQILQPKSQPIYPEADEGRTAIEMVHFTYRPNPKCIDRLAIHFSYTQTFIPVQGSLVLVVAPPPRNREAGPAGYELDYEKVAAFVVDPGQAAFIYKGTWHDAFTLGNGCTFINVTRKNPGEGPGQIQVEALQEGRVTPELADTLYVEFVDIKKRDSRIIELEL